MLLTSYKLNAPTHNQLPYSIEYLEDWGVNLSVTDWITSRKLIYIFFIMCFMMLTSSRLAQATQDRHHTIKKQTELQATILKQRQAFQNARDLLKKNNLTEFKQALPHLVDYPLYPYLVYEKLKKTNPPNTVELIAFIQHYNNMPLAKRLAEHWLKQFGAKQEWHEFIAFYEATHQNGIQYNVTLQCKHLVAQLKTGHPVETLTDTHKLWLVGHSQPKACDPLFKAWVSSKQFNSSLYWERAQLALAEQQYGFAKYLSRFLSKPEKQMVQQWTHYCRKPRQLLKTPSLSLQQPIKTHMLSACLKKLVEKDPHQAIAAYEGYANQLIADDPAVQDFFVYLARYLSYYHDPEGPKWLAIADPDFQNEILNERKLRYLLADQNWYQIPLVIDKMPEHQKNQPRWQYWHARAHYEQLNHAPSSTLSEHVNTAIDYQSQELAHDTLIALAKERSYYGLLASRLFNLPFSLNQQSRELDGLRIEYIASQPSIRRARELYAIDWINAANREWFNAMQGFNESQRALAAELASIWGWHYQAIIAASKSNIHDHLAIRFPTPYRDLVARYTEKYDIPADWVYGVMRQESAFKSDARSRVGARGLMQLMPSTAKTVARRHSLPYRNPNQLISPQRNIQLGVRYLADLIDEFNGNQIAATAAYNAGPSRSRKWLKLRPQVPKEIWIETIPIKETREYVQNIQTYQAIYRVHLANISLTDQHVKQQDS